MRADRDVVLAAVHSGERKGTSALDFWTLQAIAEPYMWALGQDPFALFHLQFLVWGSTAQATMSPAFPYAFLAI